MKLHEFLLPGAALFCLLALLLLPEEGAQAARDALALCAQTVVPSLFPFFVLSALLTSGSASALFASLLSPLMRPLFYDFPEEKNYGIFDEYMFGPDLMVCPVYEAGCRERSVYLPMGSVWIDAASGREYGGGSTISVEAPLARIPLFLRKGGTITEDMLR